MALCARKLIKLLIRIVTRGGDGIDYICTSNIAIPSKNFLFTAERLGRPQMILSTLNSNCANFLNGKKGGQFYKFLRKKRFFSIDYNDTTQFDFTQDVILPALN